LTDCHATHKKLDASQATLDLKGRNTVSSNSSKLHQHQWVNALFFEEFMLPECEEWRITIVGRLQSERAK
jgi:hypothetical protein